MPWAHGTYFSHEDEQQAKDFLKSQGLTEDQISGVRAWERSQFGAQITIWSSTCLVVGGLSGVFIARFISNGCWLF